MTDIDLTEESTPFLTQDKFWKLVDEKVWELDISYLEATLLVCTEKNIDPEDLGKLKLVNPMLKDRLKLDGMAEGYLKRESRLPI